MNQKIRKDFPILTQTIHNYPLVYLDNAATTHKPNQVITSIVDYYQNHNSNIHRGVHHLSEVSTQIFEQSRYKVASFMGAKPNQLIWTRNTTEGINMVAQTWANHHLQPGDVIVTSELEHHSNLVPWQRVAQHTGSGLTYVDTTPDGQIDLSHLELLLEALGSKTKLIALTALSNTTGAVLDIPQLVRLVKKHSPQAKILLDGAQWVSRKQSRFNHWDIDFWVFSGHKMYGPMGIGGLVIKESIINDLEPWLVGGGMIDQVELMGTTYTNIPDRFDAGTPDVAGAIGLSTACDYLLNLGFSSIESHDRSLTEYALDKLSASSNIQLIGPVSKKMNRLGSVAFTYKGVHAHDVAQILDSRGVAVRSGHHCTMPFHQKMNYHATTRASFAVYNTIEDIDQLLSALKQVEKIFKFHQ